MKYSLNPIKWLVWLYYRIKLRKSYKKFPDFCAARPLSKTEKQKLMSKMDEAVKNMDWQSPLKTNNYSIGCDFACGKEETELCCPM